MDRSALEPGYALRCTIGVAIPLAFAAWLGQPALGVAAAIGAFITGFTSLQGIYRTRLRAILVAALGMAVTSFIGALAAHSTPGIIVATAVIAYVIATLGQIGPAASTVALNSFVAFVLFSSQPLTPTAALVQSALVLAGGIIQAILLLVVWPTERLGVERVALADVYRNLAAYARAMAESLPAVPPITPFATARQVLADPQPFARSAEMARFDRLLEDSEVIRRRLAAVSATIEGRAVPSALRALLEAVAGQLDVIGAQLTGTAENLEQVGTATLAAFERFESAPNDPSQLAGARDLAAYLQDATQAAAVLTSGSVPAFHLLSKPRPGPYVQNHVDWLSRESLRFGVVLAIAMAIGRHFEADRGYWIPLTAALVLKPDFQTTMVRGFARIAGTLVGAAVASLVIAAVRGHDGLKIAGIILAAAGAYLTFNPNYALFTVAITSFVVLVLSMRGLPGTTALEARVLDTLAGGTLAIAGYFVLPTWERKRTRALLADLLDAQRRLATAILKAYANPANRTANAIEEARTAIWKTRTEVEASIDRSRGEPHRPHTIGVGRALRILAATQRFALASLALETALETQPSTVAREPFDTFASALNKRMAELAEALRESRRVRSEDNLRAAWARLESELDAASSQSHFLVDRSYAYVDAVERLARLIGRSQPKGQGQ